MVVIFWPNCNVLRGEGVLPHFETDFKWKFIELRKVNEGLGGTSNAARFS
jgi:hypothetical protein